MILKTLDPCLLDMELEKYIEINNLNINPISLFQEIQQELSENLFKQRNDGHSTDGPVNFIENLTDNLQPEFDETLREDDNKKLFLRSLTKIFAILLSTRDGSVRQIIS